MSDFRVPFGPSETEFTEKRSRFIGHLLPVETEEQAREFIAQMKKKYWPVSLSSSVLWRQYSDITCIGCGLCAVRPWEVWN